MCLGSHHPLLKTESTWKEGLSLQEVTSTCQSRCTRASSPEKGTEHPGLHKHLTTCATFCLHRQNSSSRGRRESKAEYKLLRYIGRERDLYRNLENKPSRHCYKVEGSIPWPKTEYQGCKVLITDNISQSINQGTVPCSSPVLDSLLRTWKIRSGMLSECLHK